MDRRTVINAGIAFAAIAVLPSLTRAAPNLKEPAMSTEAAPNAATTPEENKALVREWFRLYEVKQIEAHNAMIHPEAIAIYPEMQYMNPEAFMGADRLKKTLEADEENFVDLHMRIDNIWAVDNAVFVEGFFIGSKLTGILASMAKAQKSKVPFLHRIEVQGRQIKLVHSYYDTALFYQVQLGLEGPTLEKPIAPWMMALGAAAAARQAKKK